MCFANRALSIWTKHNIMPICSPTSQQDRQRLKRLILSCLVAADVPNDAYCSGSRISIVGPIAEFEGRLCHESQGMAPKGQLQKDISLPSGLDISLQTVHPYYIEASLNC